MSAPNSPLAEATVKWSMDRRFELTVHRFEDSCVVHHSGSNDTHHLDLDVATLIALLQLHGPCRADELPALPAEATTSWGQRLAELFALDLVVKC